MTASTQPWIVSPTASFLRYSGGWLLDDAFLGGARELTIGSAMVWDLLCRLVESGPLTLAAAADAAAAVGIPASAADRCVDSLRRAGVLVPATSRPSAHRDTAALHDWRLANLTLPADYRNPDTLKSDLRQTRAFAAAETPPPASRQWPAKLRRTALPHPVHDPPDRPHYIMGSVLYYSHAILKPAALGPLPRSLRVPPSHGAGHPFDLTVALRSRRERKSVLFAYDPADHTLVRLPADPVWEVTDGHMLIAVHLAVRRVQWRYRASTAYPTVFLDLGHLLGVMEAVAETLDLALAEIDLPAGDAIAKDAEALGPVLSLRQLRTDLPEKTEREAAR